jgi:hypothetical protein
MEMIHGEVMGNGPDEAQNPSTSHLVGGDWNMFFSIYWEFHPN